MVKKTRASDRGVSDIRIDQIDPDPEQPRRDFLTDDDPRGSRESLEALAWSIQNEGLHQPITVRPEGRRYVIVMGERRCRACSMLGWKTIPAIVRDVSGEELELARLSENLQRSDLSDIDVALAMKRMLEKWPDLRKADLAKTLNRPPSYVSRMLAMSDPRFQDLIVEGVVTYATVLEKYKSLSAESQERLAASSRERGTPMTHSDIEAEASAPRPAVGPPRRIVADGGGDFMLPRGALRMARVPALSAPSSRARVSVTSYAKIAGLVDLASPSFVDMQISDDEVVAALKKLGVPVPRDTDRRLPALLKAVG